MFCRVYKNLINNSYRPYLFSKINLWNFINNRHSTIKNFSIFTSVYILSKKKSNSLKTGFLRKINHLYIIMYTIAIIYLAVFILIGLLIIML